MFAAVLCWCALALWPSLHLDLKNSPFDRRGKLTSTFITGLGAKQTKAKIATFEKGHFSPLTQLAKLGVLLIIRFNQMRTKTHNLWNGHFWKASIIWNCDGTWSGWRAKKTNFQEALKIQPGAVRPRTLNICLEFCEVCCWRFGWAGNEAKINFGPGFQNLDKTNLEAPTTPLPWLSKWAPWRTWWWRTLELFWNRSNKVILIVS